MALEEEAFNKKRHDRSEFHCESDALNRYLKQQVSQDLKGNECKAYVLHESGRVVGFYTLSPGSLACKIEGGTYASTPGYLIGRLAVDASYAGKGYGRYLLRAATKRATEWMILTSGKVVFLEAKDEKAKSFYLHLGFSGVSESSLVVYVTLRELLKQFKNG